MHLGLGISNGSTSTINSRLTSEKLHVDQRKKELFKVWHLQSTKPSFFYEFNEALTMKTSD
jgi:hypothetical protein